MRNLRPLRPYSFTEEQKTLLLSMLKERNIALFSSPQSSPRWNTPILTLSIASSKFFKVLCSKRGCSMDWFELQRGRNCLPWDKRKCFKRHLRELYINPHRLSSAILRWKYGVLDGSLSLHKAHVPSGSSMTVGIGDLLGSAPLDIFVHQ